MIPGFATKAIQPSVDEPWYDTIGHDGPGLFYLSKVPDGTAIEDYEGDGEWFKIGEYLARGGYRWEVTGQLGVCSFLI